MRRILGILIPLGGLVLTAVCTASSDADIPAVHGSTSASPGPAGTADAVSAARTQQGQANVLPVRS